MPYDLTPMKAPRLTGKALELFAWACESPLTSWAVLPKLQTDAGIRKLRELPLHEAPTVRPPLEGVSFLGPSGSGEMPALEELAARPAPAPEGFRFPTVHDYARAYREGRTTPRAVAEQLLEAVERADQGKPPLRALIQVDREDVLRQADAATARFKAGAPRGLFDGVPVAVKDELDQIPYRTTVGTSFMGRKPATEDATVVARMREAGALLIGKANMHEIGIGMTGFNPHHGTARNPYNPKHHTGGSSSGPAAAVAAGLCPVAIGADGGGSIRVPAGLCGVFGLKPTWSRVSEHGAAPLCWSVAHVGPLAGTARDTALGYALMAGPDPQDPHTLLQPPPHLDRREQGLEGLRIGVYPEWFEDAAPKVATVCRELVEALCERGAVRVEVEVPELDATRIAHVVTIASEMAAAMERYGVPNRRHGLDVRINLAVARSLTSRDYVQAQRMRTRMAAHFARIFERVDVLATPTAGITAPETSREALRKGETNLAMLSAVMRFAFPANFNGMPGISIPAGYDHRLLPVGLQLMAGPWAEHLLLDVAEHAEALVPRRQPEVWLAPELGA